MSELIQAITNIIPQSLDDIIRENREHVELLLSTEEEISTLVRPIANPPSLKDTIDDWRMISLVDKGQARTSVLLLGNSQKNHSAWITSPVLEVDFDQMVVLTRSGSLYQLGSRGNGQPTRDQLIHVCATLHTWGLGEFLGAPHFFY